MELNAVNNLLVWIRFIFVVLPFPGYIHPDEYFQSTEVMAGDLLELKSRLTWEWTDSSPIRNILHPFLSSGVPFWILKHLQLFFRFHYTSELLLVVPRLFSLFFIFIVEKCIERLFLQIDYKNTNFLQFCMFLFRSSYVTMVMMTRTFSNLLEVMFFTFFLYIVIIRSRQIELVRLTDGLLGAIAAVGSFIRPTFLCYALYPAVFISLKKLWEARSLMAVMQFVLVVLSGFLCGACSMFVIDNLYYSAKLNVPWPLTPLNFILYNTNEENIKLHPVHPRCLHLFVNMFLILGPLYLKLIKMIVERIIYEMIPSSLSKSHQSKPRSIKTFLSMSIFIPVCILSLFTHQEPRYIIPILIPVIFIVSSEIHQSPHRSKWVIAWLLFNSLCILWFGFLHQSGVYRSVSYMNKVLVERTEEQPTHIVYWRTYMVPQHLLGVSKVSDSVAVHDLGGVSMDAVKYAVETIITGNIDNSSQKIWLFCPSSFHTNVTATFPFRLDTQFYPHISMEDIPRDDLLAFWKTLTLQTSVLDLRGFLRKTFSLNAYVLHLN